MSPKRPSFAWSVRIARVAGVEVRVHLTMVLFLAWVVMEHLRQGRADLLPEGLALGACTFAAVTLHELGHVLMARRFGIATRDITLLPIGGVSTMERLPDKPREEIAVALVGPLVNIVIAAVLFLGLVLGQLVVDARVLQVVGGPFLGKLVVINLMLAAFNLLPAFPMDGGRVLRAVLARHRPRARATELAARIGQIVAVGLAGLGLLFAPTLVLIAIFVWVGADQELQASVMQAKLSALKVADAMVPDFRALDADTPLSEAVELSAHGFQHDFPVRSGGELVGMLSREAMLAAVLREGENAPVGHALKGALTTVDPATPLSAAVELMRANEARAAAVLDHGRLAGVLTTENVAERLLAGARR